LNTVVSEIVELVKARG